MLRFYSTLLVINLLLTALSFCAPQGALRTMNASMKLFSIAGFIAGFAGIFVLAVAAVPMHRFILIGEVSKRALPAPGHTLRFFCWFVVVGLISLLPFLAAIVIAQFLPPLYVITQLVAFCACVFLVCRFAMVLPAVAIGDIRQTWRGQLGASWNQMRGQVGLLIAALVCLIWPFILLLFFMIVAMVLIPALTGTPLPDFENTLVFKLLDDGLIPFAIFVLEVGLASWLYAWVRQQPNKAQSSGEASMPR